MKTSSITMIINYAGLQLPVHKSPTAEDITPLKPIVDMLGLIWQDQRSKIMSSDFYRNHLGIFEQPRTNNQVGLSLPVDRDNPTYLPEVFIRIDRIASYFMTINPERVRANGNISGADYLQQKITEWADALHDYESMGFAVNLNHHKHQSAINRQRKEFAQMIAIKNKTPDQSDRSALNQIIGQMADELDIKYQQELLN
ncbi:hypothetical protein F4V57_07475 [Acinetobacter qingfengensis]|uniref:Uncharacterized protein n=1 Tax=Acinetobacter qingfengensis TaxID=1262585 RepID=A0A1E7R2S7_9GAMM|nr:hypothetical protein [Acinetobacter qingfengensis]KAA8733881.1 hypothetical protein F4V57_07475 [Acinetobacter qingfengensis]OEY93607.1 hypothetical protein BJI46_03960 [Acinetobacter qingfengensis]